MIVVKGLLFLLVVFVVPFLFGNLWLSACGLDQESDRVSAAAFCLVTGSVTLWALFQLVAVPLVWIDARFTTLVWVFCLIALAILGAALFFRRKAPCSFFKCGDGESILYEFTGVRRGLPAAESVFRILLVCGIALLFIWEVYHYLVLHYVDDDDARFIVTALEAYEHNQMLRVNQATGEALTVIEHDEAKDMCSPWMLWIALISKLVMIHPAILAHGIYAVVLLLLSTLVFLFIGQQLFPGKIWQRNLFLLLSMLVLQFLGGAYAQGMFVLGRIWQGKATLAGVGIPFLFLCYLLLVRRGMRDNIRFALFFVASLALCLLSGMGVIFSGALSGALGLCLLLAQRDWRRIWKVVVLCLPALIYGGLYLLIR